MKGNSTGTRAEGGHWQWQQQRKLVRCGCCALAGEFLFWPFVQTDVAKNRCNCCCWYCCCCYLFHCGRHWVGLVFVAIWLGQKRRGGATFKLFWMRADRSTEGVTEEGVDASILVTLCVLRTNNCKFGCTFVCCCNKFCSCKIFAKILVNVIFM